MLTEADIERIMGAQRKFVESTVNYDEEEITDDFYMIVEEDNSVSETNGLM